MPSAPAAASRDRGIDDHRIAAGQILVDVKGGIIGEIEALDEQPGAVNPAERARDSAVDMVVV